MTLERDVDGYREGDAEHVDTPPAHADEVVRAVPAVDACQVRRPWTPNRRTRTPVLWVALALLVIQQIESNILVPRLTAHAVGLHPIGSILALVLGFEVGGVIGALFAVPIAGLLWVLFSTALNAWRDRRVDLQRRLGRQALGWPRGRSRSRARGAVRHVRSG